MRILVIGTTDCRGGAASVGWNLGAELSSRGHSIKYLVGYKKSNSTNVIELSKPKILSWLDSFGWYDVTSYLRQLKAYILSNDIDSGVSKDLLNHPWYKSADIVHLHNLHGNFFKLDTLIQMSKEKKYFGLYMICGL